MAASDPKNRPAKPTDDPRGQRLKAALKANLARRKAQARARAGDTGADQDEEPQGQTGMTPQEQ
jgi:hypothetical protein